MDVKNEFEYDFSEDIISVEEGKKLFDVQQRFIKSYIASKDKMTVEEWLPTQFEKEFPERSKEEIKEMSDEIITSLKTTEDMHKSHMTALKNGRSSESWLESELKKCTSHMSAQHAAQYLNSLDNAVKTANEQMANTILTKAGRPSMNMNLDGFIAEQHHVNTFNLDAAAKGRDLRAVVIKPKPGETYNKNSVDIEIKGPNGNVLRRYQAKFGANVKKTLAYIKKGNYRGQQLLVPKEQREKLGEILKKRKVKSVISEGDVMSKPITKEDAERMRDEAQKGNFLEADWNDFSTKEIAKGMAKQAGYACLQGAAIGAGMSVLTKVCRGEEIKAEEVVETAIKSGADFGIKTATAGALKAASEKGMLKVLPKGTSAGTFTNIAFVAIEDAKVLYKVATGELTIREGLAAMEKTTVSCIAGIAASAVGAAAGESVGIYLGVSVGWAVGGPIAGAVCGAIGAVIGKFVGGVVGYIAGSKLGELVVEGTRKVRETAKSALKAVGSAIGRGLKAVGRAFARLFA